jgi:hypothetical protein
LFDLGSFLKIKELAKICGQLSFLGKSYVLIFAKKWVGLHLSTRTISRLPLAAEVPGFASRPDRQSLQSFVIVIKQLS